MRSARAALLLLAACAAPPPAAAPEAPPPLAAAALAEWEAWGGVVVEGWPDLRPANTAATPARFERLLGYWEAIPGGAAIARRHAALRATLAERRAAEGSLAAPEGPGLVEDISVYARPAWSAAFIGAVAQRAGMARADLPPSPTHWRYIDALLARAALEPETAPFLPFAPEERAPEPGDLICADRATWRPLAHWTERLGERGRARPMHCDVVVRAGPGAVEAVGGNVEDMVVLRRLPADETGRVLPAPPGRPGILLILAARAPAA